MKLLHEKELSVKLLDTDMDHYKDPVLRILVLDLLIDRLID